MSFEIREISFKKILELSYGSNPHDILFKTNEKLKREVRDRTLKIKRESDKTQRNSPNPSF